MDPFGKLRLPIFLILAVLALGTLGYHLLYPASFVDALYMTVITVFTVGYGEAFPLDAAGKLFRVFLIFAGVGSLTLVVTHFFQFMLEGRMFVVIDHDPETLGLGRPLTLLG
jgi:voltage-gated potassium channel